MNRSEEAFAIHKAPHLILMMGAPGSGKSTVRPRFTAAGMRVIDVDEYAAETRQECVRLAAADQAAALAARENLLIDSTGRFPEKWVALAKESRAAGYSVGCVMVSAPLEVCRRRVADRPRRFPVPEQMVSDAWYAVRAGFADVAEACDWAVWVNNGVDDESV